MNRLFTTLLLLAALSGYSADRITATVTITNFPVTGDSINGRIWTNATTAQTILTNLASLNSATTNMFLHFAATPLGSPNWILGYVSSNAISFEGQVGQAVAITLDSTNWASVTYETNTGPQSKTAIYPFSAIRGATNQTDQASSFVKGLSDHSTNAFAETSTSVSNLVNRTQAQDVGNKRLTNSTLQDSAITNATRINGTVHALTNGQYITPILRTPTMTNGVNYGDAFSSPGTGANSEQLGTGSSATGDSAVAVGNEVDVSGLGAFGFGNTINNEGPGAGVVGFNINVATGAEAALFFGYNGEVLTNDVLGIGNNITLTNVNAGVISVLSTATRTTRENELTLGASIVYVPSGRIEALTSTNNTLTGTNTIKGDLSFDARVNTSLANGNNAGVLLGTNVYLRLMGPSAAYAINGFAAERAGAFHILQLTNPAGPITIANESGTDPTAANRILTSVGADLSLTNNPAFLQIIYDDAASRWRVITHSR